MSEERMEFQAEVSRLLQLMVHSVYSDKEVFLRELISNASDACDKLRYEALTRPELTEADPELRITVTLDSDARTIRIADNGIGMDRDDLVRDLGTIARSGTGAFVDQLSGDAAKDVALIGQFGVGFYSVFMVADSVTVTSRKAGDEAAWTWSSDGTGTFTIAEATREDRGTTVEVHLREGEDEWLEAGKLSGIVKTYSDHVAMPITLVDGEEESVVNQGSALWTRSRNEVTEEQYTEFYRHAGHAFDEPWLTVHYRAEGKVEYSVLLFVPSSRPFDLFDPARRNRVKLYVKRIFITDDCQELIPPYLRFLKGVVDCEDLPLNISREMLQTSPMLAHLKSAISRRVLNDLEKKAKDDAESFTTFWDSFGAVLKEGIYEDQERQEAILKIARFRTSAEADTWVSLDDYKARAKDGQAAIYYITGDEADQLARSPQLEGYRARGIEVLLLTDPVDNFWLTTVPEFDGTPFRSVTRGSADLDEMVAEDQDEEGTAEAPREADVATLSVALKQALGEQVKEVRASTRLTDSAVCMVADEGALDMHLERLLKQQQQLDAPSERIMEINPRHDLIRGLIIKVKDEGAGAGIEDAALLLLDQALILEGESLPDPAAFARRMSALMARDVA